MGDTENSLPPSKKRAAGRELSRDNPGLDDEEDTSEQETGTFKRASDEVLANRRIVKVRRQQSSAASSSNPFAGIRLVPQTGTTPTAADAATETPAATEKGEKTGDENGASNNIDEAKDENNNPPKSISDETVAESGEDKAKTSAANQATEAEVEDKKAEGDCQTEDKNKQEKNNESKPEVGAVENEKAVGEVKDATGNNEDNGTDASDNSTGASKPVAEEEKDGETDDKKDNASEGAGQSAEGTPVSSFQQLSSTQNAFSGFAGTGFSSSSFSFGAVAKDGSALSPGSGTSFGQKTDQSSPFSFALSNNGSSSLFGTGPVLTTKNEGAGFPSAKDVSVETGEENEKVVFTADSVLFEFLDATWKERGKGELKVNVSTTEPEKARLVMRARGNYRLILNASLYPEMKLTNMDKKGITFACVNSISDGKDALSTFAAKFKDASIVDEFRAAVTEHKGKTATAQETQEDSSKASEN